MSRIFAQPGSGTTLLDAINDTSRGPAEARGDRRVMVVITTEGTDFSTPNHERAVDAIEASGAAFNALVITRRGGQDLSTDEARSRALVLDQGPRVSGGRYTQLLSSMALKGELDQVATDLENQYHVVYARPASLLPAEEDRRHREGARCHRAWHAGAGAEGAGGGSVTMLPRALLAGSAGRSRSALDAWCRAPWRPAGHRGPGQQQPPAAPTTPAPVTPLRPRWLAQPAPPAQRPSFRAGVELVSLNVTVTDRPAVT